MRWIRLFAPSPRLCPPFPTGRTQPSAHGSPVFSRVPHQTYQLMSPPLHAGTASGSDWDIAWYTTSIACIADQPNRNTGDGGFGWNSDPGLVTTSSGRKWPSFGKSPPPARFRIAMRLAETVHGSGQLIGPADASGAFE